MRECFGWMALGPVRAWAGGGCANELGGCGLEFHGNVPNKKPQTKFICVPSRLNQSVMGKTRGGWAQDVKRYGCVRERLNHCGDRRRPRWRSCESRGGMWVQRYSKWSSTSGTTQAGGAGRIGCLCSAYSLVAVTTLATWLKSPATNISCPQALNKTRSRQCGRLP